MKGRQMPAAAGKQAKGVDAPGKSKGKAAGAGEAVPKARPERPVWLSLMRPKFFLVLGLWLTLFAVFLVLEWAAVYFVVSIIALMVYGTNSKPRKAGKKSAYSVFNPNFERLDGELDPATIDKELRRQLY